MEVSTFELLVKRIAPPPNDPVVASQVVARRVVQGYFLTISNLEDQEFLYALDFHISLPTPPDPDRTLAGNNVVVRFDVAGANQPLTLRPTGASVSTTRFSTSFRLGAKQTASFKLLPNLTETLLTNPNPDLEVRGFVELRLPTISQSSGSTNGSIEGPAVLVQRVPQSDRPVKVLLNPEIRGTFLPNTPPNASSDFDQINYPLELASGKGLNEVEPDSTIFFPLLVDQISQLAEVLPLRDRPTIDFSTLDEEERAAALVEVISQIEPSEENLQNVSDLLSKLNVPIEMQLVS